MVSANNRRSAIITGAGQGLGRAYAKRLAADGFAVTIADIDSEKAAAVAQEVKDRGGSAIVTRVDVADGASCEAMASATRAAFGRIDVLINNAAMFSTIKMKPFWEIGEDEWDRLMAINLKGVWLATKAVIPAMREAGGGSIINISSAVVWIGRPYYAHYVASKAGVIGLTRAMARELGDFDIRVNAITPGATYTEVPRETVAPEQKAAMVAAQCIKRPAEPNDLVGYVAFLASPESAFISGQTLNIDGGFAFH